MGKETRMKVEMRMRWVMGKITMVRVTVVKLKTKMRWVMVKITMVKKSWVKISFFVLFENSATILCIEH